MNHCLKLAGKNLGLVKKGPFNMKAIFQNLARQFLPVAGLRMHHHVMSFEQVSDPQLRQMTGYLARHEMATVAELYDNPHGERLFLLGETGIKDTSMPVYEVDESGEVTALVGRDYRVSVLNSVWRRVGHIHPPALENAHPSLSDWVSFLLSGERRHVIWALHLNGVEFYELEKIFSSARFFGAVGHGLKLLWSKLSGLSDDAGILRSGQYFVLCRRCRNGVDCDAVSGQFLQKMTELKQSLATCDEILGNELLSQILDQKDEIKIAFPDLSELIDQIITCIQEMKATKDMINETIEKYGDDVLKVDIPFDNLWQVIDGFVAVVQSQKQVLGRVFDLMFALQSKIPAVQPSNMATTGAPEVHPDANPHVALTREESSSDAKPPAQELLSPTSSPKKTQASEFSDGSKVEGERVLEPELVRA